MSHQSSSPIDLEQLNQISEGDIEFEIEVLQVFVEDVSQRLISMREASLSGDHQQVMAEAHHIKGSSSNVGALQIKELVLKIENLEQAQLNAVPKIVDDIFEGLKPVELFIVDKINGSPK